MLAKWIVSNICHLVGAVFDSRIEYIFFTDKLMQVDYPYDLYLTSFDAVVLWSVINNVLLSCSHLSISCCCPVFSCQCCSLVLCPVVNVVICSVDNNVLLSCSQLSILCCCPVFSCQCCSIVLCAVVYNVSLSCTQLSMTFHCHLVRCLFSAVVL